MTTLAKFHAVDPKSVGLESFGKPTGFYNRQIATFNTISEAQSQAVDVDTKKPVGKINHFDDMVAFFSDRRTQPKDRSSFVHGDYKIDNVVFHKTEPRVIGILEYVIHHLVEALLTMHSWEMATVGHPLSDLVNLTMNFVHAVTPPARELGLSKSFWSGATPGLPSYESLITLYTEISGYDPRPDLTWGNAFGLYRGAIIMQGIAARYALRQASSAKAHTYIEQMPQYAEICWYLVQKSQRELQHKARL